MIPVYGNTKYTQIFAGRGGSMGRGRQTTVGLSTRQFLTIRRVLLFCMHIVHRYDNFIVGLTNVSPNISTPTLYNYTLCGQYPGTVSNGTTVSVKCQDNLPPFRYVIVQIPLTGFFVVCEVEVFVRGTRMLSINIVIFTTQEDSCSMLFLLGLPTKKPSDCIA